MKRELSLLLAWAALLLLLAVIAPGFFTAANLKDLLLANAPTLLVAAGMTVIILLGQIDISIGAQFAIASVAAGTLAKAGLPTPLLPIAAAAIGTALGSINGLFVAPLGIPSIVVTLATMVILRDSLRWITGGAWVQDLPASFQWFGLGQTAGQWVLVLIAFAIFGLFLWALRGVALGRAIYATGADKEAARLSGIPVQSLMLGSFCLMGLLTGLAAWLNAVRFSDVQSNSGVGLELKAISAVVVGGVSINGGRGNLIGTFLGVMLLGTIGPALTFLGVSAFWEKALQGAIILIAVLLDRLTSREAAHGRA